MAEAKKVTSRSRGTKARKTAAAKKTATATATTKTKATRKKTATRKKATTTATTKVDTPTATSGKAGGAVANAAQNVVEMTKRKWAASSTAAKAASSSFTPSELSNIGNFKPLDIQGLFPSDLFTDSSNLPYTSPSDYDRDMEQIRGKVRSVQILRENLGIVFQLTQAEGDQLKILTEEQKNRTLGVKLQQAQVDTQIAETQLAGRGLRLQQTEGQNEITNQQLQQTMIDVNGETEITGLRQETWGLKLQGLRLGITEARDKLTKDRNRLNEAGIPS